MWMKNFAYLRKLQVAYTAGNDDVHRENVFFIHLISFKDSLSLYEEKLHKNLF